jgi:hypothetical protein
MVMGLKDLLPAIASCCANNQMNIQINLLLAAASIAFAGEGQEICSTTFARRFQNLSPLGRQDVTDISTTFAGKHARHCTIDHLTINDRRFAGHQSSARPSSFCLRFAPGVQAEDVRGSSRRRGRDSARR